MGTHLISLNTQCLFHFCATAVHPLDWPLLWSTPVQDQGLWIDFSKDLRQFCIGLCYRNTVNFKVDLRNPWPSKSFGATLAQGWTPRSFAPCSTTTWLDFTGWSFIFSHFPPQPHCPILSPRNSIHAHCILQGNSALSQNAASGLSLPIHSKLSILNYAQKDFKFNKIKNGTISSLWAYSLCEPQINTSIHWKLFSEKNTWHLIRQNQLSTVKCEFSFTPEENI